MEKYYFIVNEEKKEGPFTLEQVKKMNLLPETLIWRSDDSNWRQVKEMEELKDFIVLSPPKTYKEIQTEENIKKYISVIKTLMKVYLIYSFFLGIIASGVTQNSWNEFLNKLEENGIRYETAIDSESSNSVTLADIVNYNRYPIYVPGQDLENINGLQQGVLFRVYKPFFSTNYITRLERNNGTLMINMIISSFLSNFIIFGIIAIIVFFYYKDEVNSKVNK